MGGSGGGSGSKKKGQNKSAVLQSSMMTFKFDCMFGNRSTDSRDDMDYGGALGSLASICRP